MTNEQMMYCVLKEHRLTEKEQLIMMAELKDKQFAEEKQQLIDKIERVINNCLGGYVIRNFLTGDSYRINELAKDIRKAMEE